MLPTAPSTSAITGIIRRHARSALTCAGAGVVLAATAGGATAAASAAGPGHSQASPLAAGSTAPAVLTSQLTGAGTLAVPGPVTHAAASAPRQAAHPKAAAKKAAARRPQAPMSELIPHGTSGPQAWMPLSGSQLQNATTIVRQAVARGMGLRAAVIAVATAMQESKLVNVDYGTSDSLGLFQQQPDCGWGTPSQVMNPTYAAGAFLRALQQHEHSDPAWASQPLWANAQAVQGSAFPYAYAKWETQAAHLVGQIAR